MLQYIDKDEELELQIGIKKTELTRVHSSDDFYWMEESGQQAIKIVPHPKEIRKMIRNCVRAKKLLSNARQEMYNRIGELYKQLEDSQPK